MNDDSPFVRSADRVRFRQEKMAKCGLFATERMFCDVYALLPGQSQRLHRHDASDKIYFCLHGEVVATVGDESRTLHPGDAAHSAPGTEHGLRNDSDAPAQVVVFMSPPPHHG